MTPPATASDAVLNQTLQHLTERYAAIAQEVLGDNLTSVVLFGSVAQGQARPGQSRTLTCWSSAGSCQLGLSGDRRRWTR